jgi:hypothetical protein
LLSTGEQGEDGQHFKATDGHFEGLTNLASHSDIEDCWGTVRKVELAAAAAAVVAPAKMRYLRRRHPPGADWQSLATRSSDLP